MDHPFVSVIVPTLGREAVLQETIESLLKTTYAQREIIIVDQNTTHTPAVTRFLQEQETAGTVRWLRPPLVSFKSLPKARNFGISQAKNPAIILFVDDDVAVEPDFIDQHLRGYADPTVGATVGKITVPNDTRRPHGKRIGGISWFGAFSANYTGSEETDTEDFMGCNFSLRADLLPHLGLFEEGLVSRSALREDSDMAVRVGEIGYKIRFLPKAQLIHKVFPTGGCRPDEDRITWYYGLFHDNFMFYAKHFPPWRLPFFILHMWRPIVACGFYYGKGSWRALQQPWRGIKDGIKAGKASPYQSRTSV